MDVTEVLHPPKAAGEHLRLESFRVLTWLRLIFEFRPWLDHTQDYFPQVCDSPLKLLWNCFVLGAPLCTLLDLLGLPTPKPLAATPDTFDFRSSMELRRKYILYFIEKIHLLEMQRQLPYGEVLRAEDFLQSTTAGFSRVIQTVRRVLNALYEVYPGLFATPHGANFKRTDIFKQLVQTEKGHISKVLDVVDASSQLLSLTPKAHPTLEAFTLNCTRICQFHGQVTSALEKITVGGDCEPWDEIFLFQNKPLRTNVMGCYRSICASYLGFKDYLEQELKKTPTVSEYATLILINLSDILSRISSYHVLLQAILNLTPVESSTHDELCSVTVYMNDISNTIEEVGKEIRTMRVSQLFNGRIGVKGVLREFDDFGAVQIDDILYGDSSFSQKYHMVVFEKAILCCKSIKSTKQTPFQNPIKPWELGAALTSLTSSLKTVHVINKEDITELHCIDESFFEILWKDTGGIVTLELYPLESYQFDQWLPVLQKLAPQTLYWNTITDASTNTDESWIFDEDSLRRSSVPKAWSLIGRKGVRSECSSMILRHHDTVSLLSPELLPALFFQRSESPLAEISLDVDGKHELEQNNKKSIDLGLFIQDNITLPDLTGKIKKFGNYPVAHGGYSDVWKGTMSHNASSSLVGIKVFRKLASDPASEQNMVKKLYKELTIWRKLDHPRIVPLLGTATDFGPYVSLVCPWFENGSVAKYMESCGDILSISDRLRLLCETADGLAYLHANSVIHGDLSGSNILIDKDGKACLGDFGLSHTMEELNSDLHTSTSIAGSVRWTDAYLFSSAEDGTPRIITTKSDIYSFGSVMLEILTGRIPYHYIRTDAQVVIELYQGKKPRRPAVSFVNDDQWALIQNCWAHLPENRPDMSEIQSRMSVLYSKSV